MIERQNVRHRYGKPGEANDRLLESTVVLYLATRVDPELIQREDIRGQCERHAEDQIRDGMYGDIRLELIRIRRCLRNIPLQDIDRAIAHLIDKLEWRDR